MELQLVQEEEVIEHMCAEEDHTTDIEEFVVGKDIQEILNGAFGLAVGALEAEGYESLRLLHPRYGRQVAHLVKGSTVIVADYRGTSLLTMEVLPKNEAEIIIESAKKSPGSKTGKK